MPTTTIAILAFLIGVVAGLRSMTAPALVAWGARLGRLRLESTALTFLGSGVAAWLLTALALGELVADKLPRTPSRTTPGPFGARILTGALWGPRSPLGPAARSPLAPCSARSARLPARSAATRRVRGSFPRSGCRIRSSHWPRMRRRSAERC